MNSSPVHGSWNKFGETFMKKLFISLYLSLALVTTPIAFNGCQAFQQKTVEISALDADQIVLRAEQAAETAKLTFHTFVHLERDNEAMLKTVNPQIHLYANTIRANGIGWIKSLRNATEVFKANRTVDNRATLNTILATLLAAVSNTNNYITQSKSAIGH
jgi:hypothetical protein